MKKKKTAPLKLNVVRLREQVVVLVAAFFYNIYSMNSFFFSKKRCSLQGCKFLSSNWKSCFFPPSL